MADSIEQKYHALMNGLAHAIDELLNEGRPADSPAIVFTLLVAESGNSEDGRVNYISNGNREDMLSMLQEFLARVKGAPNVTHDTKQ